MSTTQYPQKLYKEGEVYPFKVRQPFLNYCELIDEESGIVTYLQGTANLRLYKGQIVKCRVLANKEKHPMIELMDVSYFEQASESSEGELNKFLEEKGFTCNSKDFVKLLLTEEKDIPFETQCHIWIQTLIKKKSDLSAIRSDCFDMLEQSELLDKCKDESERERYQSRLTLIIEQIGYNIKAMDLIGDADDITPAKEFVDTILKKLQISGFIYHPTKNFNILSALFLMHPELMNESINRFLEIICNRGVTNWKKEPFRSALIKLLELYVRECDGKIDKTKNNAEIISNNIRALAIQSLLLGNSSDDHIIDYKLNSTRLCTLSSYCKVNNPKKLVDLAYHNMFNSETRLIGYNIENVKQLVIPNFFETITIPEDIDTENSFTQNKLKLSVSKKGIHLLPAKCTEKDAYPIFPTELGLWKGLQVYLNKKLTTQLPVKGNDIITPYRKAWEDIEIAYFNSGVETTTIASKSRIRHKVEDTVRITFVSQDKADGNKYRCHIEDEIGGDGYIYLNDIVPYPMATSLRYFFASDGSRLVFNAKIIDQMDGEFQFSMKEELDKFAREYYYDDEDIVCSMGGVANANGYAPAISKEGISVSINNAGEFENLRRTNTVICRYMGPGAGNFHIECKIIKVVATEFDLITAFRKLMDEFAVARIPEKITLQEEQQILEVDKVLDESYVRETIYLIDRMALLDKEYVKSYNYLGFARVLSMMIGWESQAAYYKGRMDIIAMLHYFATNGTVNDQDIEQLANANADLFSSNIILRERFNQLQVISFLGKPDHNVELFQTVQDNPILEELASLVLAFNITSSYGMMNNANDIQNKIKQKLNLKGYETGLRQYGPGREDDNTEYKTSIVFAAEGNKMTPAPKKQMEEILKVINSFLNTTGGTLYVGVNDVGLGVGIENDLAYDDYRGDKDKYARAIPDAMALKWNNLVATYVESVNFETDGNKDVLVVKVKPHPDGVPFGDDLYYVRLDSSKRSLTKKEYSEYCHSHKSNVVVSTTEERKNVDVSPVVKSEESSTKLMIGLDDKIATSKIRKNVVVEYEDYDNYVEPVGFLKFISGNKFKKLEEYDYDDDSLLTLTVLEEESKGALVLGYDNGHIVKVSIEELMEFASREYSRFNGAKLMFASVAKEDDAVLTISKEDKAKPKIMMRADSVSCFDYEKLTDDGVLPYNDGLVAEILAYDIIPGANKNDFKNILDKPKTFVGLPSNNATRDMINKLHLWGINQI